MRALTASLCLLVFAGFEGLAHAGCETLVRGPVAIDVQQCVAVKPEQLFPLNDSRYTFIRDLPPSNRAQFLDTYRGLLIKGPVVKSMAIRTGLSPEKGALSGETLAMFVPPNTADCRTLGGKRVQAELQQTCCEGGGEVPCLLGTSYVLQKPQVLGANGGKAGKAQVAGIYQPAVQAIGKKDFKQAASLLEKLRQQKPLDSQGEYLLALSYRELDQCQKAKVPLESLQRKFENNSYWVDDEFYVRRGSLLWARCLSMMGQAGDSVLILRGFLVEPKRFQKEIAESLSHPDFGGIRTDKDYIDYQKDARKGLAQ